MASKICGTEYLEIVDVPDKLVREPGGFWQVDLSTGELKADRMVNSEEEYERRTSNS